MPEWWWVLARRDAALGVLLKLRARAAGGSSSSNGSSGSSSSSSEDTAMGSASGSDCSGTIPEDSLWPDEVYDEEGSEVEVDYPDDSAGGWGAGGCAKHGSWDWWGDSGSSYGGAGGSQPGQGSDAGESAASDRWDSKVEQLREDGWFEEEGDTLTLWFDEPLSTRQLRALLRSLRRWYARAYSSAEEVWPRHVQQVKLLAAHLQRPCHDRSTLALFTAQHLAASRTVPALLDSHVAAANCSGVAAFQGLFPFLAAFEYCPTNPW